MKRVITLFAVLLMGWSVNACHSPVKPPMAPLSLLAVAAPCLCKPCARRECGAKPGRRSLTQIFCHNDYPETITDYVTLHEVRLMAACYLIFPGP